MVQLSFNDVVVTVPIQVNLCMIFAEDFNEIAQCSIDSLLERTIKHMLFLESITKHADKLNICAESKVNAEILSL